MRGRRLKFLFIQPEFPRQYVTFFPVYEPLHGLLFGALIQDIADTVIFDRRFDTDKNLERVLKDFNPDMVGTTTHVGGEIGGVKRILRLAKRNCPKALTMVGGQHATLLPEDLSDASTDLIFIGPGETSFREVAETVASGSRDFSDINGLAIRAGKSYSFTPPRSLCPHQPIQWPVFDRSLLSKQYRRKYFNSFERRTTVYTITSSGCPHRCSFCSLWAAARGTYRRRTPEEIALDIASQPQPFVHICDDNTFCDERHAMELCRLLKKHGVKKKFLAYARTDTIVNKTHILEAWREVGLGALVVGMEAATDGQLSILNKRTDVDTNIRAQKILDELNIENWAHFVILPEFEKEDFQQIWDFVDQMNITYPVFVPLTPVPGTPMFFDMKKAGKLSIYDYGYYNMQYMVTQTKMPKAEWYRHFRGLYARSCSPQTLWRRRKSPTFHIRPAAGRALVMGSCMRKIGNLMDEQIHTENTVRYEDIEHTLPPSLRNDYRPINYYNSPTLAKAKPELAAEAVS